MEGRCHLPYLDSFLLCRMSICRSVKTKDFDSSGFGQRHLHLKFKVSIFSNRWLEKRVDLYARVGIKLHEVCSSIQDEKNTAHTMTIQNLCC